MNLIRMFLLTGIFIFSFSRQVSCQDLDTTNLVTSAILRDIDFTRGIWEPIEISTILRQASKVSLFELETHGIVNLVCFMLVFPEEGIVKKEIDDENLFLYDPSLVHGPSVFVFDIITNNLYVIKDGGSDDTLALYYLLQHRLDGFRGNIYRKRNWNSVLHIEGVSMRLLRKKAQSLRKSSLFSLFENN